MSRFFKLFFTVAIASVFALNQPVCAQIGWATMNGGTTGGAGGETVTVTNASQLENALGSNNPMIIRVSGMISGDFRISNPNKTLEGLAEGAGINGTIQIRNTRNIILRNLIIRPTQEIGYEDAIEISGSENVWITHCDVSDHRQDIDGLIDIVRESDFITVSWTRLWYPDASVSHRLAMLIGNSDDRTSDRGKLKVTLHNNWWAENVRDRMPRVRYGEIHVFNSYYNSPGNGYCIGPGFEAQVVIESNYFEDVRNPHRFFGGDPTAQIRVNSDNIYENVSGDQHSGQGNAFAIPYEYTLERGQDVKSIVMAGAGPQFGDSPPPPPPPTKVFRGNGILFDSLYVYETTNADDWSVLTELSQGQTVFGDRTFTFEEIPQGLQASEWIQTAMDSRSNSALEQYATITTKDSGVLYVAHSDRIDSKPAWLSSFTQTDMVITVRENETTFRTLTVYEKAFSNDEEIQLGINSNDGTTTSLMYIPIFRESRVTGVKYIASQISEDNLSIHPNPFNPIANLTYSLKENSQVEIGVYNINGALVKSLGSGFFDRGIYTASFNGSHLPSGVYFVRMSANNNVLQKKIILLK